MEYRRNIQRDNESPRKRGRKRYRLSGPVKCFLVGITGIISVVALMFGTSVFTNPEIEMISSDFVVSQHDKEQIIAYSENSRREPTETKENGGNSGIFNTTGSKDHGKTGILFGEYPGEYFALSMTGEGSGAGAGLMGDKGRAYGLMQLDYRYALVPFAQWATAKYPDLWSGLQFITNVAQGDSDLVGNQQILAAFENARSLDNDKFLATQCEYFKANYYDGTYNKLKELGIDLDQRHIAVSSALLSLQVNCGSQTTKVCNILNADMSDAEMISTLYANRRNGYLKKDGKDAKRWVGEEQQALAMLSGEWTIDKDYTEATAWSGGWFWSKLQPIYFQ